MKEFRFTDCVEIKELLGKRANDVAKLLELIEEVPADCIYYHTTSYFLRHVYIAGAYPNDFATWAVIQVRDRVLGEKLASVTPSGNKSIEDIRTELIDIIDHYLSEIKSVPFVYQGQPFYFMKSRIVEVPTKLKAENLKQFIKVLKVVDASAIYNHVFEASLRDRRGRSDFSIWLNEVLGLGKLADEFEKIDSYMYSLEGLRNKLIDLCTKEVKRG
jgi:hypothetical protein